MSWRLLSLRTFRRHKEEDEHKHFPAVRFSMFKPGTSNDVSRPSMSRAWGNLNMVGALTKGLQRLSKATPSRAASPASVASVSKAPASPVAPPPLPEEAALTGGVAAMAAVNTGSSGGLYLAPGAESAIEEAQRAAAQARRRALTVRSHGSHAGQLCSLPACRRQPLVCEPCRQPVQEAARPCLQADADGALQILRKLMVRLRQGQVLVCLLDGREVPAGLPIAAASPMSLPVPAGFAQRPRVQRSAGSNSHGQGWSRQGCQQCEFTAPS